MKSALVILRRGLEPRRLVVFTAGLLLVGAGCYGWLLLPDSSRFYLVMQAVCGLLLLAAAGALVAGVVASLAVMPELRRIRRIARSAPIGALLLVLAAFVYWLAFLLESAGAKRIYVLSSWLSYHLNRPVPIPPFRTAWEILFLFVYLALLPALAIPALAWWLRRSRTRVAGKAVPSTGNVTADRSWRANFFLFWAVAIALAVLFDWLPWELAWWAPRFHQGWAEVLSAVLRLGVAGLAFSCGLVIQWSWYIGNGTVPAAVPRPSVSAASAESEAPQTP